MKNKSLITNICLIAGSVLSIIFLALPFITMPLGSASGYQFFEMYKYLGNMEFKEVLFYLAPLFILIAAIVLLVFSVLALLGDLNVIKSEGLAKASRVVNMIAGIVLGVFALIAFIMVLVEGLSLGAGLILTLIVGIVAAVASILSFVWAKKN